MDGIDGGMVCQRIRHYSSHIIIYGMTAHSLRRYEHVARRFGAQALLDKADVQGLQRCLADCAAGRTYIQQGFSSPGQAYRLLTVPGAVNATSLELSPRETEVLDWTIEGLTAKEVAARMALSEATVKRIYATPYASSESATSSSSSVHGPSSGARDEHAERHRTGFVSHLPGIPWLQTSICVGNHHLRS